MSEQKPVCLAWLDEHGQCDLDAGHYPETRHLLVNTIRGEWCKTIWPFDEDDPDVRRYIAAGEAAIEEDNRQMAEQLAAREAEASGV